MNHFLSLSLERLCRNGVNGQPLAERVVGFVTQPLAPPLCIGGFWLLTTQSLMGEGRGEGE